MSKVNNMKKVFLYTEKDFYKLVIISILVTILFGLYGLVYALFLQWLTRHTYMLNENHKHGISNVSASRLGGLAIFSSTLILYFMAQIFNIKVISKAPVLELNYFMLGAVLGCFLLGLKEDFRNNSLTPRFRLTVKLLIFGSLILLSPSLIPKDLQFLGLNKLMSILVFGWLATVVFCVGFVNSVNMADGANGLVPGIATLAFSIFYLESSNYLYAAAATSCGLFTIFNVLSGRIFLGDAGSYGIGGALVISGLFYFSEGIFSASFLACLFMYPCFELIVTLIRRTLARKSIFLPDNDHLHNRLHYYFQRWIPQKTLANSMTGIVLVGMTSGLALAGYLFEIWPVTSNMWIWIFVFQCLTYLIIFYCFGLGRRISQHVVDI